MSHYLVVDTKLSPKRGTWAAGSAERSHFIFLFSDVHFSGLAEKKVEEHQVSAVQDYICSNRLRAKIPIIQYIFWGAPQLEFDIGFIRTFTSSQWVEMKGSREMKRVQINVWPNYKRWPGPN